MFLLFWIAIVADAASKNSKNKRDSESYPDQRPYDEEPSSTRDSIPDSTGRNDVASAVEACSNAAQQDGARVDEIRNVTRDGEGWRVEGRMSGGKDDNFTCGATNGEVDFVQFGDREI